VTVDDLEVRERAERPEKGLLPRGLIGIARTGADPSGEVLDPGNLVPREEQLAQLPDIKPPERRPLDGAIVQVEAIDIHIGLHASAGKKQRPAFRHGLAPSSRRN